MCNIEIFLMYLFHFSEKETIEEIPSMPNVARMGPNKLISELKTLIEKGLSSVLLFGVVDSSSKVQYFIS